MRWQSSRALVTAAAFAACVTTTETFYLPPKGASRITEDELRERANHMLHVECTRLLGDRTRSSGETELTLDLTREGDVSRVRLDGSSGDSRLDDVFGGLAATLRLERTGRPARDSDSVGLTISYSCSPAAAFAKVTRTR